jgi:hypothetical protein
LPKVSVTDDPEGEMELECGDITESHGGALYSMGPSDSLEHTLVLLFEKLIARHGSPDARSVTPDETPTQKARRWAEQVVEEVARRLSHTIEEAVAVDVLEEELTELVEREFPDAPKE